MKTLLPLALCLLILLTGGCVSTGVQPQTVDAVSAAVRPVAKNVVNVVLAKNPQYADALLALAASADAALNGADLSVESIKAFVDTFALKYEIDPTSKLFIASAIDDVAQFYFSTYGAKVASATDPNLKKILTAFAQGIRDGVAFHRALTSG